MLECLVPPGYAPWRVSDELRQAFRIAFETFPWEFTQRRGVTVQGRPESVTAWAGHATLHPFWAAFVRPLLGYLPQGRIFATFNRLRPPPGNPSTPVHPDSNFGWSWLYVDGEYVGGEFDMEFDSPAPLAHGTFYPINGAIPHWVSEVTEGKRYSGIVYAKRCLACGPASKLDCLMGLSP